MSKIIKLTESDLNNLIKKVLKEQDDTRYMLFSNLEQLHRQTAILLEIGEETLQGIIENGHDWAEDHISTAKENIDQVFDFIMNEVNTDHITKDYDELDNNIIESKTSEKKKEDVPTNPELWKKSLAWAKTKYKVCPSRACDQGASKHYKGLGGKWRKK